MPSISTSCLLFFLLLLLLAYPPGYTAFEILLPQQYTALQGDLLIRVFMSKNSTEATSVSPSVTRHSNILVPDTSVPSSSLNSIHISNTSSSSFNSSTNSSLSSSTHLEGSSISNQHSRTPFLSDESGKTLSSTSSPITLRFYAEHDKEPLETYVVKAERSSFLVPCGVVVHGGNHFARLEKDGEVLYYSKMLNVTWPKMMIGTPSRLETYHSPADFEFRFISSQCLPHSQSRFNVWVELLFNASTAIQPSTDVPIHSTYSSTTERSESISPPTRVQDMSHELVGFYKQSNLDKKRKLVLNDSSTMNSVVYSVFSRRARSVSLTSTIPSKTKMFHRPDKLKVSTWDKSPELFVMQSILLPGGLYSNAEHKIRFGCQVVGPAGVYSVRLVSDIRSSPLVAQSKTFMVDWSDDFKLHVPRQFLFPCFSTVLVSSSSPECIGRQEKIRLYAILRANVTSTNPPLIERYITERRAKNGKTTAFECSLFKDEPTEYCFVYVNTAQSGAVSNVRRQCIGTFKPSVLRVNGNWGNWSSWTVCTATCGSGIEIRYRLCNSPSPRNGGLFCVGQMLQTRKCELSACETPLPSGIPSSVMPPVVEGESPNCQCGCHIFLEDGLNLTISATAAQCDGASSWVIEGPRGTIIILDVCRAALLPGFQWLKIRDGNTTSSPLLLLLPSTSDVEPSSEDSLRSRGIVMTTSEVLLIDFRSDVNASFLGSVWGFCVNVRASNPETEQAYIFAAVKHPIEERMMAVHIVVLVLGVTIICSILGYATYYWRNYPKIKTHLVEVDESPLVTPCSSPTQDIPMVPLHHTPSTTTLTEVISVKSIKFGKPKMRFPSYSKLKEGKVLKRVTSNKSITSLPASPLLRRFDIPILRQSSSSILRVLRRGRKNLMQQKRKSASFDHLGDREISPIKEDVMTNSFSMHPLTRAPSGSESSLKKEKSESDENHGEKCKYKYGEYRKSMLEDKEDFTRDTKEHKENPKSSKDRLNLERLRREALSRASSSRTVKASSSVSDMSMNGAEMEMEYDYYDYDVGNASAAPGSLFGMDPTIMPWDLDVDELEIKTTSDIVLLRDTNDSSSATGSEDNTTRSSLYSPVSEGTSKGDHRKVRAFNFPSIVDPLQQSLISNDSNSDEARTEAEEKTPIVENMSFPGLSDTCRDAETQRTTEVPDKILNVLSSDDFQFADESTEEEDPID